MNAPTRHLVALVIAGNLMGCQLIKKFTDRNRDSGTVAPTGTTVVTLDGGMAVPVVAYDAAMWGDAAAAMAAANAAAANAMANAADAQAMAAQAMQNAQNALADAGVAAAPGVAPGVAPAADPAAPPPVAPAADPAAPPAAPPPVAAADPAPAAPPPAAPPAADPAPAAPAAAPADDRHHRSSGSDFCRRHPGEFNQRTGQICPNVLGSHNLGR